MKTENLYCDFCQKMTTSEGVKKEPLNGFCIEIGYSYGGWGSRKSVIPEQSFEICNDCFKIVLDKSNELSNIIKKLRG